MSQFVLICGLPRSGVNAVAWLLMNSGFGMGHMCSDIGVNPGVMDAYQTADEQLRATFLPAMQQLSFAKYFSRELTEPELRELTCTAARLLNTEPRWAIRNHSALAALPFYWPVVRDYAFMVDCRRDPAVIKAQLALKYDVSEFDDAAALHTAQRDTALGLFAQAGRPVLTVEHSQLDDGEVEQQLAEYLKVAQWGGDVTELGWLDALTESFERFV